mgnify:CR=1 FL=1
MGRERIILIFLKADYCKYKQQRVSRSGKPFVVYIKLFFCKAVLAQSANGAYPIVGDILKLGAGGDSLVGSAFRFVVNIAAGAYVFCHGDSPFDNVSVDNCYSVRGGAGFRRTRSSPPKAAASPASLLAEIINFVGRCPTPCFLFAVQKGSEKDIVASPFFCFSFLFYFFLFFVNYSISTAIF